VPELQGLLAGVQLVGGAWHLLVDVSHHHPP
jgi:hypothetical protein